MAYFNHSPLTRTANYLTFFLSELPDGFSTILNLLLVFSKEWHLCIRKCLWWHRAEAVTVPTPVLQIAAREKHRHTLHSSTQNCCRQQASFTFSFLTGTLQMHASFPFCWQATFTAPSLSCRPPSAGKPNENLEGGGCAERCCRLSLLFC